MTETQRAPSLASRVQGCLLGGATGDALGAPVEFLSMAEIADRFGARGVRDFAPAYGRIGGITDDTQMTLFTAEGLIRASLMQRADEGCDVPAIVHEAYLRWLMTQRQEATLEPPPNDGWLLRLAPLWALRAPGLTCLSALKATPRGGRAQNGSKGCGGVMRVAPVGLLGGSPGVVFETAAELAHLTHGHPSGFLSAGALAIVIRELTLGKALPVAIEAAKDELRSHPGHADVLRAIEGAQALAALGEGPVDRLGAGWVAEEALAIALYCSLLDVGFEEGVILAVNHSGDSDSTGAITGNILGALLGAEVIPKRWLDAVELRQEIEAMAHDLLAARSCTLDPHDALTLDRYPVA
jgi:ADP-ribosylglycohydrolase